MENYNNLIIYTLSSIAIIAFIILIVEIIKLLIKPKVKYNKGGIIISKTPVLLEPKCNTVKDATHEYLLSKNEIFISDPSRIFKILPPDLD